MQISATKNISQPQRYRADIRRLLEAMNNPDDFAASLLEAREEFCQE